MKNQFKQRYWYFFVLFLFTVLSCGKSGTGPTVTKPKITAGPEVKNIQSDYAEITWTTDVDANSMVHYGTTSGQYSDTKEDASETKSHFISLTGLQSNTDYYFEVESKNYAGTTTSSEQQFSTILSASELLQTAWSSYENGDYLQAIQDFKYVLDSYANNAEAFNGLGWSYAANSVDSLDQSLFYFNSANNYQTNFSAALAGRGFVNLALKQYVAAGGDFEKVLQVSPNFVFDHDNTVTVADVKLGLAEVYFYRKQYNQAQSMVNNLAPDNGLNENDSNTWVVDGTTFSTYLEALLAWIEKLKSIV